MRALLSPFTGLFKRDKEEEKVKEEGQKPTGFGFPSQNETLSANKGTKSVLNNNFNQIDMQQDTLNEDKYFRFGLDSEIDIKQSNLEKTHKISKIYDYPDFDIKEARLPTNFVYVEHDLRQNSISNSSIASSILRTSQLQNILPPGMNPDNSNLNKTQESTKFDLSFQKDFNRLRFEEDHEENLMRIEHLSGIAEDEERDYINNILVTESDDNHHLIKLVDKLKENVKENQNSCDITPNIKYIPEQKYEPKAILGIKDFNRNNGNKFADFVRIHDIDSQVDEDSQDSFEKFESFPASKHYIGVFPENDKSQMKIIKKPLEEMAQDDLNKQTSRQPTDRSQLSVASSTANQQGSKVLMKFKMNPTNLQSILKPAKTQTTNDKTLTKSKLDDTVPEEFSRSQEPIETVNPKLYLEQNRFMRSESGKKGIGMATEVFSGLKPQKLNKRSNTEFIFEKNMLYPSTVQSTPRNMLDSLKTNSMHENIATGDKKCIEFVHSSSSEMIDVNSKIENTLGLLISNVNKLNEYVELQNIENSDLLANYLEFGIQKTREIIFNNTELAKLTIDLANLKNIRDFLAPFNNIPKVNLIIANLQTISVHTLEKEDLLRIKRKDVKTARLGYNPSPIKSSPRFPMSNQVANNMLKDYSSNVNYLIPEYNESRITATQQPSNFLSSPPRSRFEVDIPESPETIKNRFFTVALDVKTKLPHEHPGRLKMIGNLFDDAQAKSIPQTEWREYLEKVLSEC